MESTNIDFNIIDNIAIFKILKQSDLDLKIYNPEYFYSIGFENVEIELVPSQSGGAYSQEDYQRLTIPFKYFVYAVQGEGKPAAELEAEVVKSEPEPEPEPESEPEEVKESKPPLFDFSNLLKQFQFKKEEKPDEKKGWFNEAPKEETKEPPKEETKEPPKEETKEPPKEEGLFSIFTSKEEPLPPIQDASVVSVQPIPEQPVVPAAPTTWIIKIPVISPPHCLGKNEYEIEECRFIEKLKQIKRQRDVGVVMKDQQMYDVGRPLYLGKVVPDDKIEVKFEKTLPGTLLDKYNRRGWV